MRIPRCRHAPRGPFGGPWPDDVPGELHWERNGVFHVLNRGKRSVTLDLNPPAGLEALKKLLATSDVVIENFTPRVMRKFGLDYPNIQKIRSDIIMVSNTGYGHTGPFSNYGAMAASLEPTHGCGAFIGYEGGPPNKIANSYTDFLASWTALRILRDGGAALSRSDRERIMGRPRDVSGGRRCHGRRSAGLRLQRSDQPPDGQPSRSLRTAQYVSLPGQRSLGHDCRDRRPGMAGTVPRDGASRTRG